jgi:hypothetical protein
LFFFFWLPQITLALFADCERSGVHSVRPSFEEKAFALDRMHAANIPLGIAACPACLLACFACFAC